MLSRKVYSAHRFKAWFFCSERYVLSSEVSAGELGLMGAFPEHEQRVRGEPLASLGREK